MREQQRPRIGLERLDRRHFRCIDVARGAELPGVTGRAALGHAVGARRLPCLFPVRQRQEIGGLVRPSAFAPYA
jgi:hypothetical protein